MTDSSESLDDYCYPRFVSNRQLTREEIAALCAPGRLVKVMPTDRVYPMAAPPAHADPRHPWHHLMCAQECEAPSADEVREWGCKYAQAFSQFAPLI